MKKDYLMELVTLSEKVLKKGLENSYSSHQYHANMSYRRVINICRGIVNAISDLNYDVASMLVRNLAEYTLDLGNLSMHLEEYNKFLEYQSICNKIKYNKKFVDSAETNMELEARKRIIESELNSQSEFVLTLIEKGYLTFSQRVRLYKLQSDDNYEKVLQKILVNYYFYNTYVHPNTLSSNEETQEYYADLLNEFLMYNTIFYAKSCEIEEKKKIRKYFKKMNKVSLKLFKEKQFEFSLDKYLGIDFDTIDITDMIARLEEEIYEEEEY